MILQRNQATSTVAQTSVLKALIKWRDFAARVEDESNHYIMPNHVMFQMASIMPVTRGEFRDSCRSNFNSMMLKYQDDIIMLVKKKMESSKTKLKEKA
jgi:exosome complex exonuclease RRP6